MDNVITLEDRMVAAHKLGVVTFNRLGQIPLEVLVQMMHETGVFDTTAEQMAYLAGYHGAMRRAGQAPIEEAPNGRTVH